MMFEALDSARYREHPVGIATGGRSREREISLQTGQAFEQALRARQYDVTTYDVATELEQMAADRPAAVLLGIHGGIGESGALQGFLESLEIPYTGSGVLASGLAMDKRRARLICETADIPVATAIWAPPSKLDDAGAIGQRVGDELGFPVVAKVNDSGSSVGVYVCEDARDLDEALEKLPHQVGNKPSAGVLFEQFVAGPEYTVGIFDDDCLGVVQIEPGEGFYDFEAKYESSETKYDVISDPVVSDPLIDWGRAAYDVLGCRGVARIDFKGDPRQSESAVMLEVNTIPGMTATSLVPKMAADRGVKFGDFVEAMLDAAALDGEFNDVKMP